MFKVDLSRDEYLTLDNNEAPHQVEVLPGKYAPSCEVMGSIPKANVQIKMGIRMMHGRIVNMENKMSTQFVADATEFRGQ